MKLNRDDQRRQEILGPFLDSPGSGGIVRFHGLDARTLQVLMDEKFADPQECQNDSPSIQEFYEFMQKYPDCECLGYVVNIERNDYRVTVEGLQYDGEITEPMMIEFVNRFRFASDFEVSSKRLYCWWD